MKNIKVKAFSEAMCGLRDQPLKLESYLKDNRMELHEKDILKCMGLLRNNKNEEIILILNKIVPVDEFVILKHQFILGLALNNSGRCVEAVPCLQKAHMLSLRYDDNFLKISTLFNLYNTHFNLRNLKQCRLLSLESKNYRAQNKNESIILLRIMLLQSLLVKNYVEAESYIGELEQLTPYMTEYSKVGFIYDKIDFLTFTGRYTEILNELDNLKKCKKYFQTDNFKYMRATVDFLIDGKPFYLYEKDFKDVYGWWHIKILQSLEEKNISVALEYWDKLKQVLPDVFGEAFDYKGGINFFKLCLDRLTPQVSKQETQVLGLKGYKIIKYLLEQQSPVRKEDLFMSIYGKEMLDKTDINKLSSVIKRLKLKYGVDIKFSRNCYSISEKTNSKAS